MENTMTKQYTLEEIKEIVYSDKVDITNLSELITSLKDYDFNSDIRNIFIALSNNKKLPEEIRTNFKNVVDSYSTVVKEEEKKDSVMQEQTQKRPPIQHWKPAPKVGYQGNEEEISLESDALLGGLVALAGNKGLKVLSSDPGITAKPEISFELNYESKPYIDNILLSLYENKDDVNVDLTRMSSTGQEVLTIDIDEPNLSPAQLQEKTKKMFSDVTNIIKSTDEKKDYESEMPPELRALKDKFHGDDPNIPNEDFKVGYSRKNGDNTYYIVANSKAQAIELAELMGYEIKKDRGGNAFEIDTNGKSMEGSKLDIVSENVNEIDELKDTDEGLTDIDVNYNNKHFASDDYSTLESLTKNGNANIKVYTPDATPNQRVVEVANNTGENRTIVFNDGAAFDDYSYSFENSYGSGTTMENYNSTVTEYSPYNGYQQTDYSSYQNENNEYAKSNAYVKTLGKYPTRNNSQAANTSFAALVIFILVMAIGFGVIYLIFGG